MVRILLVGATGGTGQAVRVMAGPAGHDVVALVRDPAVTRLPDATVVNGDARDVAAVSTALAGVDAVVSCLGVRIGQEPGTVRSEGTAALVAAMRAAGVRRLVCVSTVGVGDSVAAQSRPARLLWPRLVGRDRLAEAERAEAAVRGSDLEWTLVRPTRLVDGPDSRVATGVDVATGLRSQVSRTALARTLLDMVGTGAHLHRCVTVTGA
ncbi:Putative NADH-flavin reductase [Micromonospora nigra]|uniref:Putative NADH-flavin reductase n=1 Tax=Micromonospora nigra TaxID=145857 RepID=A0A1C6T329_9ACTN|nr:NAD(P)H-binding protein [Micromonospora nigra]SCL36216.1 Putative NADH-flavin reductase [Micromonospora nigra]